jgi:hypothetical protein
MITKFNFMPSNEIWRRVKNHCRTTDNKDFTGKDATDTFKKKILFSEHSPIRLLEFDWTWENIKYWVSTEWSRHKFEKFISTQRNDRQKNYDRNEAPQGAFVKFDGYANMQNLIDAWRKRLCFQATNEARQLAEDFKRKLHETHPIEADVLVPHCVYRGCCSECFNGCGFWNRLTKDWSKEDITDINKRYQKYNEWFYNKEN